MREKYSQDLIFWFFLALFVFSIYMIGWLLLPFLSIIVLAYVVAGIFNPVYRLITVKDSINPPFASFLTCFLIFFILFVPIIYFIGKLANEAQTLLFMGKNALATGQIDSLLENSDVFNKIKLLLAKFDIQLAASDLNRLIAESGQKIGLFLFEKANAVLTNMLKFIASFFFMLLITFYLLLDGEKFFEFIINLSPLPREQDEKLIQKFKDMSGAILIGNGLCGVIQGFIGGILFAFFGLPSPFLWGVIMSLLAFLPILGIGVIFIPVSILFFLKGQMVSGIFFVVFYIVLSGSIEYLLKPKIVGDRIKMHPLLVFLAIIGGLNLFGVLGIIYGPLIVTVFFTMADIYYANYQTMVDSSE